MDTVLINRLMTLLWENMAVWRHQDFILPDAWSPSLADWCFTCQYQMNSSDSFSCIFPYFFIIIELLLGSNILIGGLATAFLVVALGCF